MAEQTQILNIMNENYPVSFDTIEFVRDSGCVAYVVYSNGCKYFLRVTKPMFYDTAVKSLNIHLFLQKQDFAVPQIIFTKDGRPYVQVNDEAGAYFYVLYEFLEGEEVDPEQDAEEIGAFIGKLHSVMKGYPGELIKNDKHYYLDRYIDIMRSKQYEKIGEFTAYGEALWKVIAGISEIQQFNESRDRSFLRFDSSLSFCPAGDDHRDLFTLFKIKKCYSGRQPDLLICPTKSRTR